MKKNIDEIQMKFEIMAATSHNKGQELFRWFARQNILIQLEIFKEQKNQFFKLKNKHGNNELTPLIAFFKAVEVTKKTFDMTQVKNRDYDLSKVVKITTLTIKGKKKTRKKVKREKLLNLWSVVQRLKAEEYSFREIAEYLKWRHRFVVSHTYIIRLWKELENE